MIWGIHRLGSTRRPQRRWGSPHLIACEHPIGRSHHLNPYHCHAHLTLLYLQALCLWSLNLHNHARSAECFPPGPCRLWHSGCPWLAHKSKRARLLLDSRLNWTDWGNISPNCKLTHNHYCFIFLSLSTDVARLVDFVMRLILEEWQGWPLFRHRCLHCRGYQILPMLGSFEFN